MQRSWIVLATTAVMSTACGPVEGPAGGELKELSTIADLAAPDGPHVADHQESQTDNTPATDDGLDGQSATDGGRARDLEPESDLRVPAEWEPHAATWMQWPGPFEAQMRPAFARVVAVIRQYEPVHLLTGSVKERDKAAAFLADHQVPPSNITWHIVPVDNGWMRDNGPVYVLRGAKIEIQDWGFDGWGGNFGRDVPFASDDSVPKEVAAILGLTVDDRQSYVLERGNLEFNGAGTLVLGWDCQHDRNPGISKEEHEALLAEALGLSQILWAYGHDPRDGTTGHIDGTARFISEKTIAISNYGTQTETELEAACAAKGLEVVRFDGDMNWLVGNGFVVAGAEGDALLDAASQARLESFFPGRDIHLIDVQSIWDSGGGIHCVTNDQPAGPR